MRREFATALEEKTTTYEQGGEHFLSFNINPTSSAYRRMQYYNEQSGKRGVILNGNAGNESPDQIKRKQVANYTRAFMATTGLNGTLSYALKAATSFIDLHMRHAKQAIQETNQKINAWQKELEHIGEQVQETQFLINTQEHELALAVEELSLSQADLEGAQLLYEDAQLQLETATAQLEKHEGLYEKEHAKLITNDEGQVIFKGQGFWLSRYYVEDENGARESLSLGAQAKALALDFCFRTTGDELLEREQKIKRAERRVDNCDHNYTEAHELFAEASEEHDSHEARVADITDLVSKTRKELDTTLAKIQERGANIEKLKERLLVLNQKFVALSKLQMKIKDPETQQQLADGTLNIEDMAKDLPPSLRVAFRKEQETLAEKSEAGTKATSSVAKSLNADGVKAPSNDLGTTFKQTIEEKVVPAAKRFFDMVAKPAQQTVATMPAPAPSV